MGEAMTTEPNQRIEPMRGSAVRLAPYPVACGALPLMAHPHRCPAFNVRGGAMRLQAGAIAVHCGATGLRGNAFALQSGATALWGGAIVLQGDAIALRGVAIEELGRA